MTFASQPWLLTLLLALPVLVIFFYRSEAKKRQMLSQFAATNLLANLAASYSSSKRTIKVFLTISGVLLVLVAMARPQWGHQWQESKGRGIDILIALDTSKSMLAEDIKPNRLERAKLAIFDIVDKLEGDRVGLIAFSGQAFLQCPLTLDYDAFNQTLEIIDTSIIPVGGTNIASAINEASASFVHDDNEKILVLITDGEDLHRSGISLARKVSEEGIKIYTVGVGSATGELIPIRQENGEVEYLRDQEGNVVKTRLDSVTLMEIAKETNAFYVPLGHKGQGLDLVYEKGLQSIPKQEREARLNKIPMERFQWPLILALVTFFIDGLLGTRRNRNRRSPLSFIGSAILVFLISSSLSVESSPQKAKRLYDKGEFEEAGKQYQDAIDGKPEDSRLYYNLGASLFRSADYNEANTALKKALATDDLKLQQNAFYNLGNTHYRMGEDQLETNPEETIKLWNRGLKNYENALNLDTNDEDAKFNYDYLKKRLQELMSQQQQEQEQQQQQQEEEQEEEQEEDNQEQDQNQQNSAAAQQNEQDDNNQNQDQEQNQNAESKPEPQEQDSEENNQNQSPQKNPSNDEQQESSQDQRVPGKMRREEARQLLDTLKEGEKKLPAANLEKAGDPLMGSEGMLKDW
jgi:Ca-activated chloride channel family protein